MQENNTMKRGIPARVSEPAHTGAITTSSKSHSVASSTSATPAEHHWSRYISSRLRQFTLR
jgi:hypothetical protein